MDVPPVALFAFKRPQETAQTFAAIRSVAPPVLFLVLDGARPGNEDDRRLCAEVRAVLDEVDWDCEVHRIYRDENLGCAASLELGLDEVFAHVPHAVVLEDDCVADPTFFRYCAELLERYRDDPKVGYIGGFALDTPSELFGGASYAFTSVAAGWGWATWADRWTAHRRRYPRSGKGRTFPVDPPAGPPGDGSFAPVVVSGGYRRWLADAEDRARSTGIMWDALWGMSVGLAGQLTITPAVNMIDNIGFGPGATHNHLPRALPPARPMPFPLVHPKERQVNRRVARELEFDALWMPVGRVARSVRGGLPRPLRDVALKALTGSAVIGARTMVGSGLRQLAQRGRRA